MKLNIVNIYCLESELQNLKKNKNVYQTMGKFWAMVWSLIGYMPITGFEIELPVIGHSYGNEGLTDATSLIRAYASSCKL